MKPRVAWIVAALAALTGAGPARADGPVSVAFVQPEKFADIGWQTADRERTLRALRAMFEREGAAVLPPGQTLAITVTEVDLAGRLKPAFHAGGDLRVVDGHVDWPRIHLSYTLSAGDRSLREGEDELVDMDFFHRLGAMSNGDSLTYERPMVRRWFLQTFSRAKAARQ